jgi:NUMOD3 motif
VTPETRAKISAALKGRPNGRLGYTMPDETRRKISKKLTGVPLSDERRAKHRARVGRLASAWKGDSASKEAKHMWLVRHFPKTGVCEHCSAAGITQYAFLRHPAEYTRDRTDYRELCDPCHRRFDRWLRRRR